MDTDICIYIIQKKPESVLKKLMALKPGDAVISVITLSELNDGVEKSQYPERNREALRDFLLPLDVAEFGQDAAECYGKIRAALEVLGRPIGSNDHFIAAHAMALGVPLVANNHAEFSRVKGLKVEAWV